MLKEEIYELNRLTEILDKELDINFSAKFYLKFNLPDLKLDHPIDYDKEIITIYRVFKVNINSIKKNDLEHLIDTLRTFSFLIYGSYNNELFIGTKKSNIKN